MPIYTFENKKTGEIEDQMISCEEMEKYLKKNKHIQRVFKPIALGDPVSLGILKPPADFTKHVLGRIKATNPKSKVLEKRWHIPREW